MQIECVQQIGFVDVRGVRTRQVFDFDAVYMVTESGRQHVGICGHGPRCKFQPRVKLTLDELKAVTDGINERRVTANLQPLAGVMQPAKTIGEVNAMKAALEGATAPDEDDDE